MPAGPSALPAIFCLPADKIRVHLAACWPVLLCKLTAHTLRVQPDGRPCWKMYYRHVRSCVASCRGREERGGRKRKARSGGRRDPSLHPASLRSGSFFKSFRPSCLHSRTCCLPSFSVAKSCLSMPVQLESRPVSPNLDTTSATTTPKSWGAGKARGSRQGKAQRKFCTAGKYVTDDRGRSRPAARPCHARSVRPACWTGLTHFQLYVLYRSWLRGSGDGGKLSAGASLHHI